MDVDQLEERRVKVKPTAAESLVNLKPLVSKDDKYLLCCCGYSIKVFSIKSGECVHELRGHKDLITGIQFNPKNQFQVISSSLDATLRKWNFVDGLAVQVVKASEPLYGLYALPGITGTFLYLVKVNGSFGIQRQGLMNCDWSHEDCLIGNVAGSDLVTVGFAGRFVAAVEKTKSLNVVVCCDLHSLKTYSHQVTKDDSIPLIKQCCGKITCLAAHPSQCSLAVGHDDGKINIWTNVLSSRPIQTHVHWHHQPVLSLCYTPEGAHLLSGGSESVLVKWQHEALEHREFLPRLGAPILYIVSSAANTLYVTSHADNSVKVIRNWNVVQVFQGLSRDILSGHSDQFPAGINFDPRSKALVTNGLPGHLQFYSLESDKLLYNLDVVGQNYVSADSQQSFMSYTRIELVEFDATGDWMVTVERWAGACSEQCRMKFWNFDAESQMFVLNTDVDTPHKGKVGAIRFCKSADLPTGLLVSVGATDKTFKLWSVADRSDIYRKFFCWTVESRGYYKDKPCTDADFSDDGTVVAVSFGDAVTLWDPMNTILCTALPQGNVVRSTRFLTGRHAHCLVVSTARELIVWNLFTYTELHRFQLDCTCITTDPLTSSIAAFSSKVVHIIGVDGHVDEYPLTRSSRSVRSAMFVPRKNSISPDEYPAWMQSSQLYFATSTGSILTIERDQCSDDTPSVTEATQLHFSKFSRANPLEVMLTSRLISSEPSTTEPQKLNNTTITRQMLLTPSQALPPITSLCLTFINSLLIGRTPLNPALAVERMDSDDEIDESSDDEADWGTNRQALIRGSEKDGTQLLPKATLKRSQIIDFGIVEYPA